MTKNLSALEWKFWLYLFFLIIGLYLLVVLKDILVILILALVFSSSISIWATKLSAKTKIPYPISVFGIYVLALILILLVLYLFLPVFLGELQKVLPQTTEILHYLSGKTIKYPELLNKNINQILARLPNFVIKIVGGFFSAILIFVLSFYLSFKKEGVKNFLKELAPPQYEEKVLKIWNKTQSKFAQWLLGQLILMFSIGIATYLIMLILKIPHPGLIGIIAGLTEIVPVIGPIFAGSVAVILTATVELSKIPFVILSFLLLQEIENKLLVPLVMRSVTAISPVMTLIAILIGAKLAGGLGILVSIPVMLIILEIYKELRQKEI